MFTFPGLSRARDKFTTLLALLKTRSDGELVVQGHSCFQHLSTLDISEKHLAPLDLSL